MDKKLKISLSIILGGYISSLGFYFTWYWTRGYYLFNEMRYSGTYLLEIAAVVFAITAIYFFSLLLILYTRSLQKFWTSFFLVSIVTLLTFFLIPSSYYASYHFERAKEKLRIERAKEKIRTENESMKEIEAKVNEAIKKNDDIEKSITELQAKLEYESKENDKLRKQLNETSYHFERAKEKLRIERAKEKIRTENESMKEIEAKVNEAIKKNDDFEKSITELQAKLEYESKENDKLRKQLNETIRKAKSLEEEHKIKGDLVVQTKSNKDFSKIKKNSEVGNTDSVTKHQEIIFKLQIISSNTRLATNSPQFNGLKNVWEYREGGLYKYTVGNEKDLKSASALQSEFRSKGFSGAFVVAFKNGKRMPVREARRFLK